MLFLVKEREREKKRESKRKNFTCFVMFLKNEKSTASTSVIKLREI